MTAAAQPLIRNTFDGTESGGLMKLFEPQVLIIILIIVLAIGVPVWLLWKIFARTGMSPGFAFLILIPYAGVYIVLSMLALGTWPALRTAQPLGAGATPPMSSQEFVPVPPAWLPDPLGQHRMRYWDGSRWTAGVHDGDLGSATT